MVEKTGTWPFRRKEPETEEEIEREIEHEEKRLFIAKTREFTGEVIGDVVKATTPKARKGKKGRRKSYVEPFSMGIFTGNGAGATGELPPMRRSSKQQRQAREPQQRQAREPQQRQGDILSMEIGSGILGVQGGILAPLNFNNGSNGSGRKKKKFKPLDITNLNTPGFG